MSRRFYMGGNGANFNMRQVAAGYDALAAPLDFVNFDADHQPGRILNQAENSCYYHLNGTLSPYPQRNVSTTTIAHGCGKLPDLVLGIARPGTPFTGSANIGGHEENPDIPDVWTYYVYAPDISTVSWSGPFPLGNTTMDTRFCTPFRFEGNNKGGPYGSGQGGYYYGGWWYRYDATNIYVDMWSPQPSKFRWIALEL